MNSRAKSSGPATGRTGQARTRLARRAVLDAARDLFLERGYAAATVEAISERSDVPPATIYRLFSAKLGILKALLDVSIAGDDQQLTLPGRPDVLRFSRQESHARRLSASRSRVPGWGGVVAVSGQGPALSAVPGMRRTRWPD